MLAWLLAACAGFGLGAGLAFTELAFAELAFCWVVGFLLSWLFAGYMALGWLSFGLGWLFVDLAFWFWVRFLPSWIFAGSALSCVSFWLGQLWVSLALGCICSFLSCLFAGLAFGWVSTLLFVDLAFWFWARLD